MPEAIILHFLAALKRPGTFYPLWHDDTSPLPHLREETLASPFPRELTAFSATALVVSNMIGTVIFTSTGFLAADLGSPLLVIGIWLAGGLMAMAGCLAYAELGINLPRSGGEYIYLREAWGPTWGFMSGWVSFFAGFSAPIAASALAASVYLGYFVPFLSSTDATGSQRASNTVLDLGLVEVHWGAGQLVAISLVAVFALVNVFGLRIAARLQNVLTTLKVSVILVFITLGVFVGKGNVGHFLQSAERTSSHTLAAQFGVSLIVVMFAYSGWNAATYVVEELRDPATVLPRVLVSGTLLVLILYLCLNMIYIYAVPLEELKGVEAVGAVTATALFGKQVGDLFSAVMAMALVSAVSAMVIAGPRVYYAMAIDGCFFPDAGRIHPRWQTPARSILYQALAASMMILVGSIEALFYYVGFALIFFAGLATAGVLKLRKREGWRRTRALNWFYPAIPLTFVLVSAWMLVYTLALRPVESTWGLVTIASGGIAYRFWLWRGRRRNAEE